MTNYWYYQVRNDLTLLLINFQDEDLRNMSKYRLKSILKKQIEIIAIKYLQENQKSKGK